MSAISYTAIQNLLDAQLATVTSLPTIYTENERSKLSTGVNQARATLLPGIPKLMTTGSTPWKELKGLYQVDIFLPQNAGTNTNSIADDVMNAFDAGTMLTDGTYQVWIQLSYRMSAVMFQQFYNVPVMVSWTCMVCKSAV